MSELSRTISIDLAANHSLRLSPGFLSPIIATNSQVPLPNLQKTVLYRALNSDVTSSLLKTADSIFPDGLELDGQRPGDIQLSQSSIIVQVLVVDDIGRSTQDQLDELEREERGEMKVGGRGEVVRLADIVEDNQQDQQRRVPKQPDSAETSRGPHKLLLQDASGKCVWGVENAKITGIYVTMPRGSKILLCRPRANRGVILLEPASTRLLGGKIETLHQDWLSKRKETLREKLG
jgi:RecQ-mediated genome instability protein 1